MGSRRPCWQSRPRRLGLPRALCRAGLLVLHHMIGQKLLPKGLSRRPTLGFFMSKLVWCTLLCLLSSPGLFVYVFYVAFAGDVMAGLLTPEEQAAAASARFGPGQPGPMLPGPSECRVFLSYLSLGLLLLPMSDRPSDLSCCCFFSTQAPLALLSQVGKSAILGFLETSEVVSGSWCIHCEI